MDVVWTEYCHDSIDLLEGSTIEPLLLQVQGRGWKCGCGVDRILP